MVEEGIDLLATYFGQASLLTEWSRDAQINTDRNLRLQYLAGMSLNTRKADGHSPASAMLTGFPTRHSSARRERIRVLKQLRYRPVRLR